jgi:hypothetical protein
MARCRGLGTSKFGIVRQRTALNREQFIFLNNQQIRSLRREIGMQISNAARNGVWNNPYLVLFGGAGEPQRY